MVNFFEYLDRMITEGRIQPISSNSIQKIDDIYFVRVVVNRGGSVIVLVADDEMMDTREIERMMEERPINAPIKILESPLGGK